MYLQGDGAVGFTDLFVGQVYHLLSVEVGFYIITYYLNAHLIPFAHVEDVFLFFGNLYQPAASVRLVDATGIVAGRGYFYLPAADFGAVQRRAEEYAAVAVRFLLELQFQDEIFVKFVCGQVAVFGIRAAFSDDLPIFHVPLLRTVDVPAVQAFAVKKGLKFGIFGRSFYGFSAWRGGCFAGTVFGGWLLTG